MEVEEVSMSKAMFEYLMYSVLDFGVYAGGNGTIITINCLGHEERLQQCSFSTSPSICTHSNDIGIHCHPCKNNLFNMLFALLPYCSLQMSVQLILVMKMLCVIL